MSRVARASAWAAPWLAAAALGMAALMPVYNPDTFGHIAAGREIAALGHVPSVDHFSLMFDTPRPWRNHNWLSGLLLYAVDATTGASGLIALSVALCAAAGLVLVRCTRYADPCAAFTCATLIVAAIPAVRIRISPRPHMFSLLFEALLLSALLGLCSQPSTRPRVMRLVALGVLQVAWVNLHGSSPFGMVMTATFLATHARVPVVRRELAWLLGLQLLASCVTPFGPALLLESVYHVADPGVATALTEWSAFGADNPPWYMASLALNGVLLLAAAPAVRRASPSFVASYALSMLVCAMGMRSSRFILDALLLGAPALAIGLTLLAQAWPPAFRRNVAVACALCAMALAPVASARLPPFMPIGLGYDSSMVPAASGEWLARNHPRARVAGALQDAWYMSYAVPLSRVLIDGRVAVYGMDAFARVQRAFAKPDTFKRLCDDYHIDAVVLQHGLLGHRQALAALAAAPDFRLVQLEDRHALYVRNDVAPGQPAFVRLHPGFGALAPEQDTSAELARLSTVPAAAGYHAYHSALALLAPYLRGRGLDGLAATPNSAAGADATRARALRLLRTASERIPEVPMIHVYHALVATRQCALAEARAALAEARATGESRETLLIAQEIALRAHDARSVRQFLGQIDKVDKLAGDGWINALRGDLTSQAPCP